MIEFMTNTKFDFVSKFKVTAIFSFILVVVSLYLIFAKMSYGVDFRGGAEVQVRFNKTLPLTEIRKTLTSQGIKGVTVQTIGEAVENEYLVKVPGKEGELNKVTEQTESILKKSYSDYGVEIRKIDIVGPKAGAELRKSGFLAMFYALAAIMIYIALRFDVKYSPGAIVALFHDVSIILGVYALTGTEFTLQTVAAILAVIGYSVNDTVIVYDRVREHEHKFPSLELGKHINNAINETLSRTFMTSVTTLFVALSMFIFGGPALHDFFLAITLGVIIGTYSSIFVAAPVTLAFDQMKNSKSPSTKKAHA